MSAAGIRRIVLRLSAAAVFAAGGCLAVASALVPNGLHLSAPTAGNIHAIAVFGTDDRRDMPPSHQTLAGKIGVLTDLSSRSQCTAFCLSESVIATAAHCLFRTHDEVRPELRNFRFKMHGRQASSAVRIAGTEPGAAMPHVMTGSMSLHVRPPIEATRDWALARLDAPVCSTGGLPISRKTSEDLTKATSAQPVYQAGYHRDYPGERLAFGTPCAVSRSFGNANWTTITTDFENAGNLILHTCDTGGASSGSPLLVDGPNGPEVVGINVGTYVLSRVLSVNGAVTHRYQSENVANTGVSAVMFADAFKTFERAELLTARAQMRELQSLLTGIGVFSGARNGLYGAPTRTAIEIFERIEGRPQTGLATVELLQTLHAAQVAKALPPASPAPAPVETGSVQGLGLTSSAQKKNAP